MKTKFILIFFLFLFSEAKSQQADCSNLYLDSANYYIAYPGDTTLTGTLFYNDTVMTVYPTIRLILSDSTVVEPDNEMVLSSLDSGQTQIFYFHMKFKTDFFSNNTPVSAIFHIYDSDMPGDSIVTCYFPINIILQHSGVGMQQEQEQQPVSIAPNPVISSAKITANNILKDAQLEIYNSLGEKVRKQQNISGEEILFNRENLQAGIYFIRLKENQEVIGNLKMIVAD